MPPPESGLNRYRLPELSLPPRGLEELEAFLNLGSQEGGIHSLDELHGFLTCVALSSPDIGDERWLPLVVREDASFPHGSDRLKSLVLDLLDDIILALADPEGIFSPLVSRSHDMRDGICDDGRLWSSGFLSGMALLQEHWSAFLAGPATAGLLLPMFLLGSPMLPSAWENMVRTAAQRQRLTHWIPGVVEAIRVQRFAQELIAFNEARSLLAAARYRH